MNTAEAAFEIGTTPRVLRQFLRSPLSTFVAVGSGSRYEFKDTELPTLQKRFNEWKGNGRPNKTTTPKRRPRAATEMTPEQTRAENDREVWAEESRQRDGYPLVLDDIRRPEVRRAVRAEAERQEAVLDMMLLKAGLHITQLGNRR